MICPKCNEELKKISYHGIELDTCPSCGGLWFDKSELNKAKNARNSNLNWMDIDLWEDDEKFRVSSYSKKCSDCKLPLYEVNYNDSDIKVDICNVCEGVWLDKGEFEKIVKYLKNKAGDKIMNEYAKTLLEEVSEVFTGPEPLKGEVEDVITVLGLLNYRIAGKHPFLANLISKIPKA